MLNQCMVSVHAVQVIENEFIPSMMETNSLKKSQIKIYSFYRFA
jgi:hypothetical protein